MTSKVFTTGTVIDSEWLNDVNNATYAGSAVYQPEGTGAVATTVQEKLRQQVSAFDFMSSAQITAVQAYTYTSDVTAALQSAMDAAWESRADLFIPSGGYLVTGLTLPGTYPTLDQRDRAIRVYGQGYGNGYANGNAGGTVLKSVTNAPVLADREPLPYPNAQGTYEIDHIRFDGNSSTPVVLINGLYGTASFHNNTIYQRGVGNGVEITYGAAFNFYENFITNRDFATTGLGAARVGVGLNFPEAWGSGLCTFHKNSVRGFLTAYVIGGSDVPYTTTISQCECSTTYNGIFIEATCDNTMIDSCYFEGAEGGIGIRNRGNNTRITNCLIFPGYLTLIDDSYTGNQNTYIAHNSVSMGAVVNATGIYVSCNAVFSAGAKTVIDNAVSFTDGTAGCTGIKLEGSNSRLTLIGNATTPTTVWAGAGSVALSDSVVGGIRGIAIGKNGTQDFPKLSQGAISFSQPALAFTQADVTANTLTLPDGSYFVCSATGAASVLLFSAGLTSGRYVTFRTTTANMSFGNSAYNQLAGGVAFTGPGTITFLIDRIGASNYAYEVSRTVF